MTTTAELDALAAQIAAGSGPDRQLDAEFAHVLLGWLGKFNIDAGYGLNALGEVRDFPAVTDALAGPGALFAAARALWPECEIFAEQRARSAEAEIRPTARHISRRHAEHPDLSRALMLAITAAKRAEIAGGNAP